MSPYRLNQFVGMAGYYGHDTRHPPVYTIFTEVSTVRKITK